MSETRIAEQQGTVQKGRKKMKRHLFGKWFLLFSVVSIIACSCEKSESYPGQTQETDVLPVATAAPCESDTYTPVISSYKRRELVIDPDNLSTADHISLYHSYGPLQELLLDEEQIAEYENFRTTGAFQYCGPNRNAYHVNDNLFAWVHHFGLQKDSVRDKLYSCELYYSDFDLEVIFDHDALYADQFYREDIYYQYREVHKDKMRELKSDLINRFADENPDGYAAFAEKYISDRTRYLQITDFTLADLLHAMQLTREEAKAAADSVISGVWIDVDMLYDRYDDLLEMQEEEKLYPVEIDMLCWGEVEELPQDPKEISHKDYTDLAPGEDPPPWQ